MIRTSILFRPWLVLILMVAVASGFAQVQISNLRCEYLHHPLGIDSVHPRLSWILESPGLRDVRQTAYRLLVATSPEKLERGQGDLWDSGKVRSDQTTQIEYRGKPLRSRDRCYWKVEVWDNRGKSFHSIENGSWTMGLLHPDDWQAHWIGLNRDDQPNGELATPRYLRKAFGVRPGIRRATVYATALGLYELRINGQRVGDHLLAPEWTNYFKRVQYQTYDVTPFLRGRQNVIGAVLGNGWYCGGWQMWKPQLQPIYGDRPYLRVQLEIEANDGSKQTILTDGTWRGTDQGPLRFSGIFEGETADARQDMPGWDRPNFDDRAWKPAEIGQPKAGQMVAQRSEAIRETQELKARSVSEPKPGVFVFDLGQNIAGWAKVRFRERAGTRLTMQYNEVLNPDGTVYMDNLHAGHLSPGDRQIDRYTCRGGSPELFEPHFTYHGFRYVQVTGLSHPPTKRDLIGVVFHSAFTQSGNFSSSDPLLNRLALNIQWSQRANMMGVPTDCCQRDERCGYTGDAQFFVPTAIYNFDVAAFYNKWLNDVCEDSQMPGGWFADHAPTFGPGDGWNVGWSDGGIICPYNIWRTYGDTRVIREHYAAMKRNMDLLRKTSPSLLHLRPVGNGDWLNLGGGASGEVIGTAYDAYDFHLMSEMARAIGEIVDSLDFEARSCAIARAFDRAYIAPDGTIKDSSQTGFALAFTMRLVPQDQEKAMSDRFAAEVKRFDDHLATGFIGTPRLLPALHLAGRDDLAYRLLLQKTYPSWLYPVTLGATTQWERWDGWRPEKGFQDNGMNSFNHYAFGSVGEYLYGVVGGIKALSPGYQRISIAPVMGKGLTHARTVYRSFHGRIVTDWVRSGDVVNLKVEVPANTTARLTLPARNMDSLTESGHALSKAIGVHNPRMDQGSATLEIGSGTYRFRSAQIKNP